MRVRSGKVRGAAAAGVLGVVLVMLTAGEARGAPGWRWPVEGAVITAYSNDVANPYAGGMHRGVDIEAATGTPVQSARAGQVTYAGALGYSGLTVAVRTVDGYVTSYLHLSAVAVRRGETVGGGSRLGAVGTTGRRSKPEPHLHFGVRVAGAERRYVDPLSLLPPLPGAGPGAPPLRAPATVPVAPEPARVRPARARIHARSAPLPRVPNAAPDWGRPLALGGLGLLVLALFGRSAIRAAARANRAASGRAHGAIAQALRSGALSPEPLRPRSPRASAGRAGPR